MSFTFHCNVVVRKVHRPKFWAQVDYDDDDLRFKSSCRIIVWDPRDDSAPRMRRGYMQSFVRTMRKRVRCFCCAFCLALKRRCVTRVMAGSTHRRRLIRANNSSPTLVWKMQRYTGRVYLNCILCVCIYAKVCISVSFSAVMLDICFISLYLI